MFYYCCNLNVMVNHRAYNILGWFFNNLFVFLLDIFILCYEMCRFVYYQELLFTYRVLIRFFIDNL